MPLRVCCFVFFVLLWPGFSLNAVSQQADTTEKQLFFVIKNVVITGNKTTRPNIIFRELVFHANDTIASRNLDVALEQSKKNLLNTSLFNFVTIDTNKTDSSAIEVIIDVIERWYIWPMPFFQLSERNFNVWWENKDFSKADYGMFLTWDNFRGRKETLKFLLKMGFDETYGLSYKIPYINKQKKLGLSFTAMFTGNHEVSYLTEHNKQVFYKDKEKYTQQNYYADIGITLRNNIFVSHIFQLNYDHYLFSDTLLALNSGFAPASIMNFFTFYYQFRFDQRDVKAYPLHGLYYNLEFVKHGLGILRSENFDHSKLHTSLRKYWKIGHRMFMAGGINARLIWGADKPYFTESGLGFGNDFVRSYEYYVVPGQHYMVLKLNFKYELIPTRIKKINFIPTKKFNTLFYALYFNIFTDAGYVKNNLTGAFNDLSNTTLIGSGIGLDFVTYYDKVLRAEFSVNRRGEYGFFLHFIAPI